MDTDSLTFICVHPWLIHFEASSVRPPGLCSKFEVRGSRFEVRFHCSSVVLFCLSPRPDIVDGSFLTTDFADSLPSIRVHLCSSVVEFLFKVRCSMFDVQCSVSLCHPWFQPDRAPSLFTALFFNHGWTRMNTDSLPSIRVYPCSSVVDSF